MWKKIAFNWESFVMYRSYVESLWLIKDKAEYWEACRILFKYALTWEEEEIENPMIKMFMSWIKESLWTSLNRYQAAKENGAKWWRKKDSRDKVENWINSNKPDTEPENKPKILTDADLDLSVLQSIKEDVIKWCEKAGKEYNNKNEEEYFSALYNDWLIVETAKASNMSRWKLIASMFQKSFTKLPDWKIYPVTSMEDMYKRKEIYLKRVNWNY